MTWINALITGVVIHSYLSIFEFWEGHESRLNKREVYELKDDKWIHSFSSGIKGLRKSSISIKFPLNYDLFSSYSLGTTLITSN